MTEEEFRAEINRRAEEVMSGADPGIPAEEVYRELMADIERMQQQSPRQP